MMHSAIRLCAALTILTLAACTQQSRTASQSGDGGPGVFTEDAAIAGATAPRSSGKTVGTSTIGESAGQSAAALNTATPAERAQAAAAGGSGRKLGTTIASLGDPTEAGFWIKTPLAKAETNGRIVNPATGKSANVRLIPLGGPASGGSQVSLPALQMLGVSLTDLPEIEVYDG